MTELKDKVTFYIPSESNGQSINNSAVLHMIAKRLSKRFGGCTVTDGIGYWVNGSGELVCEPVKLVYCYGDFSNGLSNLFFLLATYIKQSLRQESVAYEINNKLVLV